MKKKLAIIGTVGVPACYGGFETLLENLLPTDIETTVYCSSQAYKERVKEYKGAKLVYIPLKANGAQSIPYDIVSCLHALKSGCNSLIILGVSGAIILPLVKWLRPNITIVTNIDGTEWRREKWSYLIKQFLKWSEHLAVKYSDTVVSDNQGIADYVEVEYQKTSRVIAYGGDHALIDQKADIETRPFALSLCRIEPENNVHVILEACAKTNTPLKFVGNWHISDYGRSLKAKYSQYDNIEIVDSVYDISTLFHLRSTCGLYLHGHSAGGTNPSLVEIMHFAKPIIAFDCVYNRATMENKGSYFKDEQSLQALLASHDWEDITDGDMEEIAQRRYTWQIIRKQYLELI